MRRAGLALTVAALGALGSGCGGGSSSSDAIAVRDFDFAPVEFTARAGESVVWENEGEQIHNVRGRGFFSRAMDAGERYSFAFERPGTYDYLCTLHPQMKGTVVVE